MICVCGSTNLIQADFREHPITEFTIASLDMGFISEGLIVPELWVCQSCRRINFYIKEEDMERVAPKI